MGSPFSHRFVVSADATGASVRLEGPHGPVPWDDWAIEAPDSLWAGVDLAKRLEVDDLAQGGDDFLLVEHRAVAALSPREAPALGMPAVADAIASIQAHGIVTKPNFRVELEWLRRTGQPIPGAQRVGAFLRIGGQLYRLPTALFDLAEGADPLASGTGADEGERLAAIARLQEVLPPAAEIGAKAEGLVRTIKVAVAGAFSLGWEGVGADGRLAPVLHAGGSDAPLLPADQQTAFAGSQFGGFREARPVYTLGGTFVVLEPTLRRALSVVRAANDGPPARRRALLANPRAVLREALGEELGEVILEGLVRETPAYSERVIGLGLWTPRVVPWIKLEANDWLGRGAEEGGTPREPVPSGIVVGDRTAVPLDAISAPALRGAIEEAIATERPDVEFDIGGERIIVPATQDTLAVVRSVESLLILGNEGEVDAEAEVVPQRAGATGGLPSTLRTPLMPHQADGLAWLRRAWSGGSPGILLADDMGLGKTLQSLAFLASIRDSMQAGVIGRAPLLIVAPTGLLANWQAEHDKHLAEPGLGQCLAAFGKGLAALKRAAPDGRAGLDTAALREADWVLTTYETLRDYDRDFGQIRFAVAVFDEAQKIKSPGVRITDAAKAMQAELKIALTGTPVENRLADLWCIVDGVHPGWLGDLKSFSATYERDLDRAKLGGLKGQLERSFGGRAPLMLRRLKADSLKDLPTAEELADERTMPPVQRRAYLAAIEEGRSAREPGAVLGVLQRLRSISLHPGPVDEGSDDDFAAASARLQSAVDRLDEIAQAGERALVFLEDRAMQARLASLIQRRYGMPAPPVVINGEVPGPKRQRYVDAFQRTHEGFDVMILSPKAGGVGLTLTSANHVIHLSRWWNPAVEDQCTGRVLRIGQQRPVQVHVPMAVLGDGARSFDQNLDALLARKRKLMRETLMPPEANASRDAAELFRTTVR